MPTQKTSLPILLSIAGMLGVSVMPAYSLTIEGDRVQIAFLHRLLQDQGSHHESAHHELKHGAHHGHHGKGCFVTTTPQNHARGIRHWGNPCPHRELRHMNPYHPPHHKMRYNPHTRSHHRVEE